MWQTKTWNHRNEDKLGFEPYYSFKCWSPIPVVCLLPHHILEVYMRKQGVKPLHEYYFEPTGTSSLIFYQFLHKDFKKGMKIKQQLEKTVLAMNIAFWLMFLLGLVCLMIYPAYGYGFLMAAFILVVCSWINPPKNIFKQLKNQKQFFT